MHCLDIDSAESAEREIGFFFPDFSTKDWYQYEEENSRCLLHRAAKADGVAE